MPDPVPGHMQPVMTGLRRCLDGLNADEIYDICRRGSEPELNDRLRHAVNRIVRPDGGLCEREASHGPLRRVDLRLVDTLSGYTLALIEAKMRYAVDVAFATDWVVHGKNGLSADLAKLAKAGPNVRAYLLLWTPYIALARRPLKYPRWTSRSEDGQVPDISLDEGRIATRDMLAKLAAGPWWHIPIYSGQGQDADLTLDAWLVEIIDQPEYVA